MSTTDVQARSVSHKGLRPALLVAVTASALAGLIHVVAARNHQGGGALVWMFALCAVAQLGWAAAALIRPTRLVLVVGGLINAGAVLAWVASRTVGVPFIDGLAEVEAVGTPDLSAALFAAVSVAAVVLVVTRPVIRAVVPLGWSGALAVFALLAALPAMTTASSHGHGDDAVHLETAGHDEQAAGSTHSSDDNGAHDAGADGHDENPGKETAEHETHEETATSESVDHATHSTTDSTAPHVADPADPGGNHGHPADPAVPADPADPPHHPSDPIDPPDPDDPHDPGDAGGPIISVDDPRLTQAERATAIRLIDQMKASLSRFTDVAAIEAAGYESIGDGGEFGYEHYINWAYLSDGRELDPSRVESIVVKKNGAAPKTIISGLYILNPGKTLASVPSLAGDLTQWHDHQNLCFEGRKLVDIAEGGVCERGVLLPTPPMLHVWVVESPCGPFAGIGEHGVSCGAGEGH